MKNMVGVTLAIFSSASFGLLGIFAEIGYQHGSNPITVLAARFSIATIVLLFLILITKKSFKVTKKQLLTLFIMGVFGYTLVTQTLFYSYDYISVGLATATNFVYPIFVCILAFLIDHEKFTKKKILALIVSVIGVFMLTDTGHSAGSLLGISLALISGILYGAIVFVMSRDYIKKLDGMVVTFYCSLFAGLATVIIGLFNNQLIFKINHDLIISYSGIAIISTVLSLVFLQIAIKEIGPTQASILGTFEPIVGVLAGIFVLGEHIGMLAIAGIVVIIASVLLAIKD